MVVVAGCIDQHGLVHTSTLTRPNCLHLSMMEDQLRRTKAKKPTMTKGPLLQCPDCDGGEDPVEVDEDMQDNFDDLGRRRDKRLQEAAKQRKALQILLGEAKDNQSASYSVNLSMGRSVGIDCGIDELAKALLNFMYDPLKETTPAPGAPGGIIGIKVPADDQQRLMGGKRLVKILKTIVSPLSARRVLASCALLTRPRVVLPLRNH